MSKYTDYFRQNSVFHPPYVAQQFDTNLRHICTIIADNWHTFGNPHVVDNMIHTSYPEGKWFHEVCDTPYRRGKYHPLDTIQPYWLNNQKINQHYSVFSHDQKWVNSLKRSGSVSCQNTMVYVPILWIEMDRKSYSKIPDFYKAIKDGMELAERYNGWAFSSGNNSSHVALKGSLFGSPIVHQNNVEVFLRLALRLTGDIRFRNGVIDPYQSDEDQLKRELKKAYPHVTLTDFDSQAACSALENIDPNIYRVNSLIRQPWSTHETGGGTKGTLDYADPYELDLTPEKPNLLYEYFKAWEDMESLKKRKKKVAINYSNNYIISELQKGFPELDETNANSDGWVKGLRNPLYNDSNPSVSVNINTGFVKDFGSRKYSMSFEEYLFKMKTK